MNSFTTYLKSSLSILIIILMITSCEEPDLENTYSDSAKTCYENLINSFPNNSDFTGTACQICNEQGDPVDSIFLTKDSTKLTLISVFYNYEEEINTYDNENYQTSWDISGETISSEQFLHGNVLEIELDSSISSLSILSLSASESVSCSERVYVIRNTD